MAGSAHEVVSALLQALTLGQDAHLATVMRTYGSSPKPVGSMMMFADATGVVGSVSGGCIEEDIIGQIQSGVFAELTPTVLSYGNSDSINRDARFALPCGGELIVLVERFTPSCVDQWCTLEKHLSNRLSCFRDINLHSGQWRIAPHDHSIATYLQTYERGVAAWRYLLGPARKLLIVGANPTARILATLANQLDFVVTICDPGEYLAGNWQTNADFEMRRCYPDGFVAREFGDEASAVVALSHDPRLDDMALIEALSSNAFYIGAMGSVATSQSRRRRLQALGLPSSSLARLKAPIGLNIGSKTPAEIAISIAAELVSTYSKV